MTKFHKILEIEKRKIKIKALQIRLKSEYKLLLSELDALRVLNGLTYEELAKDAGLSNKSLAHRLLNNTDVIRDLTPIEKILLKKF